MVKDAIDKGRAVLATFSTTTDGWDTFSNHFQMTPKEALEKQLPDGDEGHAVVIREASGTMFTLKNSWGPTWGFGGHFVVKQDALCFRRFIDVHFTSDDVKKMGLWIAKRAQ